MATMAVKYPLDPFSDAYQATLSDDTGKHFPDFSDEDIEIQHSIPTTKGIFSPRVFNTPSFEPLTPTSSSISVSVESGSAAFSSPASPTGEFHGSRIEWSNSDLMYLVACLYPRAALQKELNFDPPLESLTDSAFPIDLRLSTRAEETSGSVPPEAFSKHAPIGTGRPKTKILLAQSAAGCTTAAEARRSLVQVLLANSLAATHQAMLNYEALAGLYALDTAALESIERGLFAMGNVSWREWLGRQRQLRHYVDRSCVFQAQFELLILESGCQELNHWVDMVFTAAALGDAKRSAWGAVYAEAARFLDRALWEA